MSTGARFASALRRASPWTLAAALVVVLAAVMRLWAVQRVSGQPFYDAAVRSMGHSWHNLWFGAVEPGGSISIDKPPVDLWLQVASTKLLGFGHLALHLPEALAGTLSVAVLYLTLRGPFGQPAALASALALAVLPASIVTARSDTMDSLLALLAIIALWLSLEALRTGRRRWLLAAAATMGVAFNVKLTEALIPLPALALLWWWTAGGVAARGAGLRGRAATLALAAATYVVTALSWTAIASLTPRSGRPYPIGSGTGSIWRVVFVFNGFDRLVGRGPISVAASPTSNPAGPLRLFDTGSAAFGPRIGIELLAALALGAVAVAVAARMRGGLRLPVAPGTWIRGPVPVRDGALAAIGVWLLTGLVLFSAMRRLQPRYLEAFTPAVAATVGASLVWLLRLAAARARDVAARSACAVAAAAVIVAGYAAATQHGLNGKSMVALLAAVAAVAAAVVIASGVRPSVARAPAALGVAVVVALLAVPVGVGVGVVRTHVSDAYQRDPTTSELSRYLLAHRDGAHYELASVDVFSAMGTVARDGLPVLVLNDLNGPIVALPELQAKVASGAVRYILIRHPCRANRPCRATERWALGHSVPVQRSLYRFTVRTRGAVRG